MIVDLALRRTAELEQMNSELLRSNEELEAFAYVASHDLKEPLRQIETFGTLLERVFGTRDLKTPEVKRWFDGIQTSSRRLRALIGDLAEYSRLGHQANPFTPVSLDELITNVRTDLETLIKSNDVNLSVGQQPVLMCDRSQMQQVIQNIIENAIKYRHVDRPPVIRVSSVILPPGNAMADLPVLELTIEDNGIGIAERHREQIFEPFQRLHSSDEYDGSGIGLAICRKIVERHRGTISVSNGIGKGSAFKIRLPMRPPFGPGNHP